jgi:hypothetical protein
MTQVVALQREFLWPSPYCIPGESSLMSKEQLFGKIFKKYISFCPPQNILQFKLQICCRKNVLLEGSRIKIIIPLRVPKSAV